MFRSQHPKRALLTWSDAGIVGPRPEHHAPRPTADRGPIRRLLDQPESVYDAVWILTIPAGEAPSLKLANELRGQRLAPTVHIVHAPDPSDYATLFRRLGPLVAEARKKFPAPEWALDVLLSAGTPQAQTLWVILVQAGLLTARMLQVVPAIFVGPDRPPIRVVQLDMEGFPEIRALRREVSRLREQVDAKKTTLIGESAPMTELKYRIRRIAASDAPVLILGETGTGKELVARALHDESARGARAFIAENCGVFAEGILASELFGHEPGAFTGATSRRKGVFEQAHTGTLFLDEVGELSPRVQAALLRALQEGSFRRVGGESKVSVDVRVIAATHKDLSQMVKDGTFREDLYFRLRGATLQIPPLRERPGDIELLVDTFLLEMATRKATLPLTLSRDAKRAMIAYPWPGNVRELRAEVERWAVFCDNVVEENDLAPEIREHEDAPLSIKKSAQNIEMGQGILPLSVATEKAEREAITLALHLCDRNLSKTARALQIDRNTLKRKLAHFRMEG